MLAQAVSTVAALLRALPSDAETVLAGVQLAETVLAAHPEEGRPTPSAAGRGEADGAGGASDAEDDGEGDAAPMSPAGAGGGAGGASGRARLDACEDFESSGSDTEQTDAPPGGDDVASDGEEEEEAPAGERAGTPPPAELMHLEPPSPLRRAPPQGPQAKQVAAARHAAADCGLLAPLCAALGACAGDARVQAEGLQLLALVAEHVGEAATPGASPRIGSPRPATLDSLLGSPSGRGGRPNSAPLPDVLRAQLAGVVVAAAAAAAAHRLDAGVQAAAVRALASLARNTSAAAATALRGQHAQAALATLEAAGAALGPKLPRQEAAEALAALRSAPPPLPSKRTALHVAVALGLPRAVRALMLRGADASVTDASGATPAALAGKMGLDGVACAHQLHVAADAAAAVSGSGSAPSSPLSPLAPRRRDDA